MMSWEEIARTMEAAAWLQGISLALGVVNLVMIVMVAVLNRRLVKQLAELRRLQDLP